MRCPRCHNLEDKVLDSRMTRDGLVIRRRRECLKCGHRFTTYERAEETMPLVVKKDGRREPYTREKVLVGIRKAFEKRPVTARQQEELVDEVERYLLSLGEQEVPSRLIGEKVMELIKDVDQVAYVRFASVYRRFRDLSDFIEELKALMEDSPPKAGKEGAEEPAPPSGPPSHGPSRRKAPTSRVREILPRLPLDNGEGETEA